MLQELADFRVEFCSLKDALDLSTSQGVLMMHLIAAFSQFEADIIKLRIRSGLDNARAKGRKLGRPQVRDDVVIRSLRAQGLTQRAIAARLGISKGSIQNALKELPVPTSIRIPS